jgi:hypothetical protein
LYNTEGFAFRKKEFKATQTTYRLLTDSNLTSSMAEIEQILWKSSRGTECKRVPSGMQD